MVYNADAAPHCPTFRHATKESADAEAKRLAELYPGKRFFVLGTINVTKAEAPKAVKRSVTIEPSPAVKKKLDFLELLLGGHVPPPPPPGAYPKLF